MKYQVFGIFYATTCGKDIVAKSFRAAADAFLNGNDDALSPALCWQCSHEVELSDLTEVVIVDENGKERRFKS